MNNRSPYHDQSYQQLYMLTWVGDNRLFEGNDEYLPNYEITPLTYLGGSHWKDWVLKFDHFELENLSPALKIQSGEKNSD